MRNQLELCKVNDLKCLWVDFQRSSSLTLLLIGKWHFEGSTCQIFFVAMGYEMLFASSIVGAYTTVLPIRILGGLVMWLCPVQQIVLFEVPSETSNA